MTQEQVRTDMLGRVTAKAVLSKNRFYRYRLERWWDHDLPAAGFVLCNPSTADAFRPDPTMKKCRGFAQRWGCGGVVIVNVCALRSPKPAALLEAIDPVGPDNREAIDDLCHDWHYHKVHQGQSGTGDEGVSVIVAGWGGALPRALEWCAETALGWLGDVEVVHCLGQTRAGRPRHPLMLAYDTPLEPYLSEKPEAAE